MTVLIKATHQSKKTTEQLNGGVSFIGRLDEGELLAGTPTVEEIGTSDLTITNKVVNTLAKTINSISVPAGMAVLFTVSGGNAGTTYVLRARCGTTASPSQTLEEVFELPVVSNTGV